VIAPWLIYASMMGMAIVLVALLLERIARWRRTPTRWVWIAAILVTVALPAVLNFAIRPTAAPVVRVDVPQFTAASTPMRVVHQRRLNLNRPLLALWLAASSLVALRVIGAAVALRRRRRHWIAAELGGQSVLLADELGPAVIGWRRFTTVIPRWALTFDERSRDLMMAHEAEHASSGDPYLRSIALFALILMPWNPALWFAARRLRLAVEMDCDQRVLAGGVDPQQYASLLLAVGARMSATPFAWATALGGSRSSLETRILAMTPELTPRRRRVAITCAVTAIAGIVAIACSSPVPDPVTPAQVPQRSPSTSADAEVAKLMRTDTMIVSCAVGADCGRGRADTAIVFESKALPIAQVRSLLAGIGAFRADTIFTNCSDPVACAEKRHDDTLIVFRRADATDAEFKSEGPVTTSTGTRRIRALERTPTRQRVELEDVKPSLVNGGQDDLEIVIDPKAGRELGYYAASGAHYCNLGILSDCSGGRPLFVSTISMPKRR